MHKFIRTHDKRFEDFLVFNFKTLGNLVGNVYNHSPDTFRYGKFHGVSGHFTEKSANGFIRREPPCSSEHVILHGSNSGTVYLGQGLCYVVLHELETGTLHEVLDIAPPACAEVVHADDMESLIHKAVAEM